MKRYLSAVLILLIGGSQAAAQDLDIFGYFEPQYNGFVQGGAYAQLQSSKLRVDIQSSAVSNTEFGADLIGTVYSGKKVWNLLDFLPEEIAETVPSETAPLYEFSYADTIFLDNIYARLTVNRFALTVGKQQISLGTGYFANPTDIFNDKDALDPTYEQTGHNAIRLDVQLKNRLQAMALYAPNSSDWRHSTTLTRLKAGLGHFDAALVLSQREIETVDYYTMETEEENCFGLGTELVGEIVGCGVWGEGKYEFLEHDQDAYEFIVGGDYTFESGFYSMVEFHHNSQAKSDYHSYDLNDWIHYFSGQLSTLARDQAYMVARYPVTDVLSLGGSCIVSISDGSVALVPDIEYSLYENIDLTLMLNFFAGQEGKVYSSRLGNGGFVRANIYF